MRKKLKKILAGILICSMLAPICGMNGSVSMAKSVEINTETIPDAQIRSLAVSADTNSDGVLSEAEAEKVESLWFYDAIDDISQALKIFPKVTSVTFRNVGNTQSIVFNSTKVKAVTLRDCNKVVALKGASPEKVEVYVKKKVGDVNFAKLAGYSNVTDLTLSNIYSDKLSAGNITLPNTAKLKSVRIYACQFKKANLSALKNVTSLSLINCGLKSLDISKYTKLTYLNVSDDKLKALDVTKNIKLTNLTVSSKQLKSLDVTKNKELAYLSVVSNKVKNIDITKNTKLSGLHLYGCKLKDLNLAKNTELKSITLGNNNLKKVDVKKQKKLTSFSCYENKLTSLNISANKKLESLNVSSNKLKKIDVTKNTKLSSVNCEKNPITALDLNKNKKLEYLEIAGTKLTPTTLKLAESIQLRMISVGKLYNILTILQEKMVTDSYFNICMVGKPGKSYDLKSMIPMLAEYNMKNTETGVVTLPKSDYNYITHVKASTEKRSCYIYFYKK